MTSVFLFQWMVFQFWDEAMIIVPDLHPTWLWSQCTFSLKSTVKQRTSVSDIHCPERVNWCLLRKKKNAFPSHSTWDWKTVWVSTVLTSLKYPEVYSEPELPLFSSAPVSREALSDSHHRARQRPVNGWWLLEERFSIIDALLGGAVAFEHESAAKGGHMNPCGALKHFFLSCFLIGTKKMAKALKHQMTKTAQWQSGGLRKWLAMNLGMFKKIQKNKT